ncbi:hypothetical protein QZH41_001343 [Actinostola sp. cb2023]|nr:hypothetical protein QZH41_001343 [Actinostola sp. cb2023]
MADDDERSDSEFYYPEYSENNENEAQNNEENFSMADVQSFIEGQRPENTIKKTQYDVNVWQRYLSGVGETREIESIPSHELNILVCRFFIDIQKKDGGAYEPSSLTSFHRSLQRYLNDKQSNINIFKDQEFAKSREVLKAKKKQLVERNAKGNRPQAAHGLTDEEEDLLFTSGEFGERSPESLQRTVWWLLSLHFGFRARDESRKLKWGDISLGTESVTGREVLTWDAERGSKTRHGESHRAFKPTAHATNNERCPVKFYKIFQSHRPTEMLNPESPFYLAINHKRNPTSNVWYCKSPLGKNEIGNLLSKAAKRVGLTGNSIKESTLYDGYQYTT